MTATTATGAALECTCPRCGTTYPIDRDRILLGTWRLSCPSCHPPPPDPRETPEQLGDA